MRIGQLAASAGTTPRAVRHYHRLGLLVEPERRDNGYRDYTMADLARLMRIRWLADSGIPLGDIAPILARSAADMDDVEADLTDLVERSAQRMAAARDRHQKLERMLAAVRDGRRLSPLAAPVVAMLDEVESSLAADEMAAFAAERDLMEILALSGDLPDALIDRYSRVLANPEATSAYRTILRDWADLEGADPAAAGPAIDDLARRMADWLAADPEVLESFGQLPSAAMAPGAPMVDAGNLSPGDVVPDACQQAVLRQVLADLALRGRS